MRIAVIPARGGSRRILRKNVRMFHGKPIIAYSIETARRVNREHGKANEGDFFDAIVVSTDDDEIASAALAYGASVHRRDDELCRDEVGTKAVIAHVCNELGVDDADEVCCIYPCAPLLTWADIHWAWTIMWMRPAYFVVAIGTEPLADAGALYWSHAAHWKSADVPIYGIRTAFYPLPRERVCDINEESDWQRAERMYAELHKEAA